MDKLFTRLYEDNVLGKISDERFTVMSAGYENEQKMLKATVSELRTIITHAEKQASDVTAFLKAVHKYEHITKLTPEVMHELIEKSWCMKQTSQAESVCSRLIFIIALMLPFRQLLQKQENTEKTA